MVDPRDVGAATAAVLITAGHDHLTYVLTGPEAITHAQVAAELSVATNGPVEFVDVPDDTARQGMTRVGVPDVIAGQVVEVYAMLRRGAGERVAATTEALTGRPAGNSPRSHAITHPCSLRPRWEPSDDQFTLLTFSTRHSVMTTDANKALIRRIFEQVIPSGDATAMRGLVTPDWVDHDPLPGQPAGLDGAEFVVISMHTAHPDLRFTIEDLLAESDLVAIRWTLRGTNTGPMLGRPPTGQPVELAAIAIFRIADGKIIERWAGWKPGHSPQTHPALSPAALGVVQPAG